ncbi:MAG: peptide ABC transporter substrate-binding protein [Planctomycetes bacterium]|nr:peptide ABC transporter substrate-binding protein [Planctomycetota bacterium]
MPARPGTAAILGLSALGLALAASFGLSGSARRRAPDFVLVNEGEPSSLDPQQGTGVVEGRVLRFLYEGLVVRDPKTLAPLPGVAERWETSADGLRWTFHLRAGAAWSDGEPLTARDVVLSWKRLLDPRTAAPYAAFLYGVRGARAFATELDSAGKPLHAFDTVGVRARDDVTLEVEFEHKVAHFLDLVAHYALAPLPEHQLAKLQREHGDRWELAWCRPENLVVNGPFVLSERRIRDRLSFTKNARYWAADEVAFRAVDVLGVEHPNTMLNLYLTGGAGWTGNFPLLLAPELFAREDFSPGPQLGTAFYRFNVTRPPLDDARVRRALALCVDRRALVERVTRAGEVAQWSFVPACALAYEPTELAHAASFAEDAARARALLADAGYGPGLKPLPPIELAFNVQSNNQSVAEVIADGWRRELGVETHLASLEWKIFLDAQRALDYAVSKSSWVADHPDPIGMLEIFRAASPNNRTGWKDAEYDALLDQAERASGPERAELLRAAEARLLDAAPIVPLYGYVTKNLVNPRLGGFFENPLDEHAPRFWYWKSDAELARDRERDAAARAARGLAQREHVAAPGDPLGLYSEADREPGSRIERPDAVRAPGER